MFNLARYFSTLSLILIGLAAGLLGLLYREVSLYQLTVQGEDRNVAMAGVLRNALGVPLSGLLAVAVGREAPPVEAADEAKQLADGIDTLLRGTAVTRVKLYNRLGVIVFSTDSAQVGEVRQGNPGFKAALAGSVSSNLTRSDYFDQFEGVRAGTDLLATYLPVNGEGRGVEGVLEIYQDVGEFVRSYERMQWLVTAVAVAIFALLYLLQYLVVRRAQGILREQSQRLEATRNSLETQVDARTQELRRANRQLKAEIAEREQAQHKLNYLAYHDPLTGLANRRYFVERLESSLRDAARHNHRLAVLFIDLDQFKQVNDSLGHGVGDELLVSVATGLTEHVRLIDMIARLGGDEFICVMESVRTDEEVAMLAREVIAAFDEPFRIGGHELFLSASIGISVFPNDGSSVQDLLRNADTAMYRAKGMGRGNFHFYTPEMTREAQERIRLETQLRKAMDNGEFSVHLQPQVDAETGNLIGAEALVRWHSPELGDVPPTRFIPVAEESGLIVGLGAWVLRESCRQVMRWSEGGFELPHVSVNLSVKQLERPEFIDLLQAIITETGIAPQRLKLEITESVVMAVEDPFAMLVNLRALGVSLALDDFGTGYSSLSYLKALPVQQLKIDRSFIMGIGSNAEDEAIIRSVMALANSLDFEVVAEGVETADQARFLRSVGCRQFQGWLHGRAVAPGEFRERWARLK